jgi:hypothetical protein
MATDARERVERARRFPLKIPMSYQKSGMLDWQDGKTVNISRTGILFRAEEKLAQDTQLDIRVQFSPLVTMMCQGAVVRTEKTACAVKIRHYRIKSTP